MKRASREFRFELEALRRKREWELDALRLELAHAGRLLQQANERKEALEIRVATARQDWARRSAGAGVIDVHWQRVAAAYLSDLREMMKRVLDEIRALHEAREQALARVTAAHRELEVLERQRERAIETFNIEAGRRELVRADENWLQRMPDEGAA